MALTTNIRLGQSYDVETTSGLVFHHQLDFEIVPA